MYDLLRARLAARPRREIAGLRRAAVLVPLLDEDGPRRLLLTRRAEGLPTHRGHVAFPGGGVEPRDRDATATALREAEEEVGLRPAEVEVLGWLDDFPTLHGDVAVTPVIGRVRGAPRWAPAAGEVARVFEVPVAELAQVERWRVETHELFGRRWPVYFFDHDGEVLWGLSAYIALATLEHLAEGAPFALPAI